MSFQLVRISALALATIAGSTAISAGPAFAGTVTKTFTFNGIGNNASSYAIQTYMASVLSSASGFTKANSSNALVGVNGALGQQGSGSYTGDDHVVGPKISGTPRPLTLGDTEGGTYTGTPTLSGSTDGFLKNCTHIDTVTHSTTSNTGCYVASGSDASSPDIFLNFANVKYQGHAIEIASFSFDFEIFPDGTCTADTSSACGGSRDADGHRPNLPDLEIWSGDNATGTYFETYFGVTPSGTKKYSVAMPGGETAPQFLGTSGTFNVASNLHLTSLDFMDWPETIGIDNLVITFRTVPEPASIAILAMAFGSLFFVMRRTRRRNDETVSAKQA